MAKFFLDSNHCFYTSTNEVKKICRSFFDRHQFSFFDYGRYYKNGDFYALSVNPNSFRIFFELEYETLAFCKKHLFENDKFYYFLSTTSHSDKSYSLAMGELYKMIGSDHGFIILKKHENYVDTFFFASPHPHYIAVNYYLNQLSMLNKFICYFQNAASQLIDKSSENRIILPKKMIPNLWGSSIQQSNKNNAHLDDKKMALTKREIECLTYICKGYTAKEIADQFDLSARTIESHLENIKSKLNIRRKPDLIKYMLSNESR